MMVGYKDILYRTPESDIIELKHSNWEFRLDTKANTISVYYMTRNIYTAKDVGIAHEMKKEEKVDKFLDFIAEYLVKFDKEEAVK